MHRRHVLSSAAHHFAAKLAPRYDGPYRIGRCISAVVYELTDDDVGRKLGKLHVKNLKPCLPPPLIETILLQHVGDKADTEHGGRGESRGQSRGYADGGGGGGLDERGPGRDRGRNGRGSNRLARWPKSRCGDRPGYKRQHADGPTPGSPKQRGQRKADYSAPVTFRQQTRGQNTSPPSTPHTVRWTRYNRGDRGMRARQLQGTSAGTAGRSHIGQRTAQSRGSSIMWDAASQVSRKEDCPRCRPGGYRS